MNSMLKQPRTGWQTMNLFWTYWQRYQKLFLTSLLIGPVSALQNVVTPLFIALGLNQLVRNHHVDHRIIIYASISLFIAVCLSYYINIRSDAMLEHRVEEDMYDDCFDYLVRQDYDFFVNNFSGSLVTRANRLIKAYSNFHLTFFIELLPQLFTVLFALGIMTYYNLLLGLTIGVFWAISVAAISYLAIRRIPMRRAAVAQDSKQTGELADVITNALTVKTFAAEDLEISRYRATNRTRGSYFFKSWSRAIRNGYVVEILCGVLQIVVFAGGILAVEHQTISLPVFLLFQVYALRIIESLRRASTIVRQFEGVFGDAQEMTELLGQQPLIKDPPAPETARIHNGQITFTDVTFSYESQSDTKLFTKLNLAIKSGEKVGLVGPSGGGKTTITKLLLRFIDVNAGSIRIDGQDIRSILQSDLHRAISYVPQEPLLFHRSIIENIRYGRPNATQKEIIQAARLAHADHFIESLPLGYDTLVGERGVKLSGGQRQRIAIARTILKESPVIVLDEATSALDSESEKLIQDALWELMKDKTAIVIAHRLSTIQKMDRIVVLDDGKIIEEGSHRELLAQKGLYAKLWSHQSGGFIEE